MGKGGSGLLLPSRWERVEETTLPSPLPRVLDLGTQVGTGPSSWERSRHRAGKPVPCHPLYATPWHFPLQTPVSVTLSSCRLPFVFVARALRSSLGMLQPQLQSLRGKDWGSLKMDHILLRLEASEGQATPPSDWGSLRMGQCLPQNGAP